MRWRARVRSGRWPLTPCCGGAYQGTGNWRSADTFQIDGQLSPLKQGRIRPDLRPFMLLQMLHTNDNRLG